MNNTAVAAVHLEPPDTGIDKMPMGEFMSRFGEALFEGARVRLAPEYEGGRPDLDACIETAGFARVPFPAQQEAVKAAFVHMHERGAKMLFLEAEMGTGKTTIATMVAGVLSQAAGPRRTIAVVPPHLVGKWAREIRAICPQARIVRINSAGANRILGKAAELNPGRPDVPEFYIIGRVRLRMDYRVRPALVRKHNGWSCPHCGGRPVVERRLKNGEDLPDTAIVGGLSNDESGTSDGFWENLTPSVIGRGSRCENVADTNGTILDGCGSPLWQAARNGHHAADDALAKAFRQLPGVGKKLSRMLADSPKAQDTLSQLEDGDIPDALRYHMGTRRLTRIERWLETHTFALQASDYASVRFIAKRMPKHWFDLALFDEVHELKGDTSAQGVAYGILAGRVNKCVCLTGTLVDGYAQSLHPLLFRADPRRMIEAGYGADATSRFQHEMGVIKEVSVEIIDDAHRASRSRKVKRQTRNLPGLHPRVITDLLLPNTVFLNLADVEKSIQALQPAGETLVRLLPSYREVFVASEMDSEQEQAVSSISKELMDMLKYALRRGGGKRLLSPVISALLRYPDDCFRELRVEANGYGELAYRPPVITADGRLPKERFIIDLAKREIAQGRKMVVFTTYTDKRDLSRRYRDLLSAEGIKAAILTSAVPTDERESWLADRADEGDQVIVCNPELVKTGLDLYDFPTLYFAQTGYTTSTVLQASRRSWRIGQMRPVRVYFAGYKDSMQMQALTLMSKKIRVAQQAKGSIADTGLSMLDDDEAASTMQALANALLDQRRDRTHDTLTGSISSLAEDGSSGEFGADPISRLHAVIAAAHQRTRDAKVISLPDRRQADSPVEIMPLPANDSRETGTRRSKVLLIDTLVQHGRKFVHETREVEHEHAPAGAQLALF